MRRLVFMFLLSFLVACCFSPPASATIQLVQHNSHFNQTVGSPTISLAFPNPVTAGDLIVVYVPTTAAQPGAFSVTDNAQPQNNVYSPATSTLNYGLPGCGMSQEFFYAANVTGGSITVTATVSTSNLMGIVILEYSGIATASPLDGQAGTSQTSNCPYSTTATSNSFTTTNATDLIVSGANSTGPATWTAGSGYALREVQGPFAVEDQTVSSTGSYTGVFTFPQNSNWMVAAVAFKAAGAPPTITTQPVNQTVTVGQTASFSVVASGAAPLSYQWRKNSVNISGATSSTYTTPSTTTSDSGSTFDVVVTNGGGSVTSNVATLTVVTSGTPTCGINNDTTNYIPAITDWDNPPVAAQNLGEGGSYADPKFGCTVTRLTDGHGDYLNGTDFYNNEYLSFTHYYSTISPMNATDTLVLIGASNGTWRVKDTSGNLIVPTSNMPAMNDGTILWDASNGNVFYYTNGNSLMSGTINSNPTCASAHNCTAPTATVHQFSEYTAINFMDAADLSQDGQHVVIVGGDNTGNSVENVFSYNFVTNTKGPVYTTTCKGAVGAPNNGCIHKLAQTSDNNVLIAFAFEPSTCGQNNPGTDTGGEEGWRLWNGTSLVGLQDCTSHTDTGQDLSGNPLFIDASNQYSFPGKVNPCASNWGIGVRQLNNLSSATCLLDHQPGQWHVSYRGSSSQPLVALSFCCALYNPGPTRFDGSAFQAPSTSNWAALEDEIVVVRMNSNNNDSTQLYRLARAYSRSDEDYGAQPQGAISRDGKYIIFNSNMAHVSGCPGTAGSPGGPQGGQTSCSDVYLIKVQ